MNSPTLKNYDELCRLCASYDAIKIPIFSERGRERNLKDKITTCLPFDVSNVLCLNIETSTSKMFTILTLLEHGSSNHRLC